jgi:hypothetical protein
MFDASLSLESLQACLADLPPVPLKGLALMERPSLLADRETVRTAVVELIAYTNGCAQAIDRLRDLPPVPLTTFVSVEWML